MINKHFATLLAQPWAIRAASMAAMVECASYATAAQEPIVAGLVEEEERETYEIADGIATIRVDGVIGKRLPKWMAEMFGMTDVDDIANLVQLANADPEVRGILLDIDSPGGTVSGVPEAADIIRASTKPVFAFADRLMASAAYWLGSGAAGIFATKSALIGSVGVFVPILDMRRAYEQAGFEMEVIKSGDLKATGYPGTSLTRAQREDLQQGVDHLYGQFREFVVSRIGSVKIPDSSLQGQDFYGDQALDVGMIDEIAGRAEVIAQLKSYA